MLLLLESYVRPALAADDGCIKNKSKFLHTLCTPNNFILRHKKIN